MSSAPSLEIQAQRLEGFQPGDRVIVRGIVSSYESRGEQCVRFELGHEHYPAESHVRVEDISHDPESVKANALRKTIARARLEARTAEAELLERYGETYEP